MEMEVGEAKERKRQLRRPGWSHFFPSVSSNIQPVSVVGWEMGWSALSSTGLLLSFLSGRVLLSQHRGLCPASHRSSPPLGEPTQTLNVSEVQNLCRLDLPITPALPLDTRSPVASVRQGIGCCSFGVSLGQ